MENMIAAKPSGEENDYIRECVELDMCIGGSNDFELRISADEWTEKKFGYNNRIFIPETEYGGIIYDIESIELTNEVVLHGPVWRGMLKNKVVEPPENEEHLVLNGELNQVLRELIEDRFDGLFVIHETDSGIMVKNWKVDRYVTLQEAVDKLLDAYGCRLRISYCEPEGLEYGYVTMQAVPVHDYSEEEEYSRGDHVKIRIRDNRGGINHLVCAGKGENEERVILHLYVQEDGSIGKEQCYYGLSERASVYSFTSAEQEQLEKEGTERLKELKNYKSCEITVSDIDIEIGDIVGGYDRITDTVVRQPVVGKILKIKDGEPEIEYEIKGDG